MKILDMTREQLLAQAKPILFSTPMVQAIRREVDPKTMTRRVVKPQPFADIDRFEPWSDKWRSGFKPCKENGEAYDTTVLIPPHKAGDILYVRETWQEFFPEEVTENHQQGPRGTAGIPAESAIGHYMYYYYRADGEVPDHPTDGRAVWMPSIFMPKAAARIFLRVTDVRPERLREITVSDILNEGMERKNCYFCQCTSEPCGMDTLCNLKNIFRDLWDSLNAKRGYGWDTNPWVWVNTFERVAAADERTAA